MKIFKKSILFFGAVAILIFCSINCLAVSDGTNDVWHQAWTGTGYSWDAYSGSKSNIDITDVSYTIDGTTATVTMTTAGNMKPNTENVVYTMHLQSSESTYYWIFYSNGQGTIMGMGGFQGFASQIENPISGNIFTTSFEISDPNLDYNLIGFNVEHSDPDAEHGEAWWDYAPNSEAPWYSPGDDDTDTDDPSSNDDEDNTNDNNTPPEPGGTPGFEILTLIAAITISIIILRKRK